MSNTQELVAREWGEGQETIVLLHGLYGHKEEWAKIAEDLAPQYHLIAFDMRNHGLSTRSQEMSYTRMAEDVASALKGRGITRALLVAHSMSGRVAVRLAQLYPELARGVIALDSPPVGPFMPRDAGESTLACTRAMRESVGACFKNPQEVRDYLNARVDAPLLVDYVVSHYGFEREPREWALGLEGIAQFLEAGGVQEESPQGGVPCPYLLIKGAASPYSEHCTEQMIREWTSPAEVIVLPHTAHFVHFQARERVVSEIIRFDREFCSKERTS